MELLRRLIRCVFALCLKANRIPMGSRGGQIVMTHKSGCWFMVDENGQVKTRSLALPKELTEEGP